MARYPKIKLGEVKMEDSLKISRKYNIFTAPAILLFINGKETIREAGYISLDNMERKIFRYYKLFYSN